MRAGNVIHEKEIELNFYLNRMQAVVHLMVPPENKRIH